MPCEEMEGFYWCDERTRGNVLRDNKWTKTIWVREHDRRMKELYFW
jgi:hypothetical protein